MLRLKQICLVAADLDRVEDDLNAILGIEVAYSDPALDQFGLRNIMLPIGNSFLEVVRRKPPPDVFSNDGAAMAATW